MNILLVSATELEIKPLKKFLTSIKEIDILITGVGTVATCYHLMNALSKKKYDYILQVGIAGSFDKKIALGSAVIVGADSFADLGVVENKNFNSVYAMGLIDGNKAPFKNNALPNPHKKLLKTLNLSIVNSVTVNEITTNKKRIDYYKEYYNASVESMEGAAFHYTLIKEKIPFLQIRTISNYVGERNKSFWKIEESITLLADITKTLINQILLWK